jgi:outer membrane biosynthesis protein TonB
VIVELVVRQDGSVENVRVTSAETANDPSCFIDAAEEAASSSSFNSNYNGPDKQKARITYQFVAQ